MLLAANMHKMPAVMGNKLYHTTKSKAQRPIKQVDEKREK